MKRIEEVLMFLLSAAIIAFAMWLYDEKIYLCSAAFLQCGIVLFVKAVLKK